MIYPFNVKFYFFHSKENSMEPKYSSLVGRKIWSFTFLSSWNEVIVSFTQKKWHSYAVCHYQNMTKIVVHSSWYCHKSSWNYFLQNDFFFSIILIIISHWIYCTIEWRKAIAWLYVSREKIHTSSCDKKPCVNTSAYKKD